MKISRPDGSTDLIISVDVSNLIRVPSVTDGSKVFFLTWNADLDSYSVMSFTDTFAAVIDTTGLMLQSVYDPQSIEADSFDRANHTGLQAIATVSGLQAALDALTNGKLSLSGGTMTGAIDMAGFALSNVGAGVPDYMTGLITANSGSWGISIGAGAYKANSRLVINGSTFTKNLNAVWAAGSGNGGRDTATAVFANGTYHLFALRNNTTGGFDAVFSPSTTPTVPAGHTLIGRIGSYVVNSGNTALVSFVQVLNDFYLAPVAAMAFAASQADGLVTATAACPCPSGVSMEMKVQATIQLNSGAASVYVGDAASFSIGGMWSILFNNYVNGTDFCAGVAKTNASRQIRCQPGLNSSATITVSFGGWRDYTLPRLGA